MKVKFNRDRRVSNPQKVEFFGKQYLEKPEMQLFTYDKDEYIEEVDFKIDGKLVKNDSTAVTWLNVHGIHDVELIRKVSEFSSIPRFIIQDILDTSQRPKLQDLGDYMFFTVKSMLPSTGKEIEIEQISFILGKNVVFSFQEKKGDHFEHVRTRIREDRGLVRKKEADFLLYLLIEGILINFFTTLENLQQSVKENIKPLETSNTDPAIVARIEDYKIKLQQVKRNVMASRDALISIEKGESGLIRQDQKKYYFDLKDQCLQIIEEVDTLYQGLDAAENLFFSLQGHRMNQVMTTLTILAAIFIPLTFMAGIYGMNFEYMPELGWKWGYPALLGVMLFIGLLLILYFRRKRWL
jgi:magnesium transporter